MRKAKANFVFLGVVVLLLIIGMGYAGAQFPPPTTEEPTPTPLPTTTPAPTLPAPTPVPTTPGPMPVPTLPSPTPLPISIEELEKMLKEKGLLFIERDVEGAAFVLPESLEDEVAGYRETIPEGLPSNAFLLVTKDKLWLVLTAEEVHKGYATVRGFELRNSIQVKGKEVSVILAKEVSIETDGIPATVHEIRANPSEYRLKLVHIDATLRLGTVLLDPDEDPHITLPIRVGYLVENPITVGEVVQDIKESGKALVQNPKKEEIARLLRESQRERLSIFDFEDGYWTDGEAEVDAIVLHPEELLSLLDLLEEPAKDLLLDENATLYSVKQRLEVVELSNISETYRRSDELRGKIVGFEAYGIGKSVSVQEFLEHSTACGEDEFPVKKACVNLVPDVLLEGMVAWEGIPTSREEILIAVGASSLHQDSPEEDIRGRFRYVGKLLSTREVEGSLPEGLALMVVGKEKTGELDPEELRGEAEALVDEKLEEAKSLVMYEAEEGREVEAEEEEKGIITQVARKISNIIKGILSIFGF